MQLDEPSLPLHPMKYQCHLPYYSTDFRPSRAGTSWERQDFPERASYITVTYPPQATVQLRFTVVLTTSSGRNFTVKHAADLTQQ